MCVVCLATGGSGCATMWVFSERLAARDLSGFYLARRTGQDTTSYLYQLWQALLMTRAASAQAGGSLSRRQPLSLCLAFWRLLPRPPGYAAAAVAP